MAVQFVSVPLKRTREVDLASPLKSFIASTYSTSTGDSGGLGEGACEELAKLRTRAVLAPLDRHPSGLQIISRYYDQLVAVEEKLPMTATSVPVPFKWKDAFDRKHLFHGRASLTLSSGSFERAAVLFNVAALGSQVAAAQGVAVDEEVQAAARALQTAAGVFQHLADSVLGLVPAERTPDLEPESLRAVALVMLAQAQEAVYLKASRSMKPSACAKLAAHAGDLFAEAAAALSKEPLRGHIDKEWSNVVRGKEAAFAALAQYQQSRVEAEAKALPAELSRLAEAEAKMAAARALFAGPYSEIFAAEADTISRAYQRAKKDNDCIYHERIPDLASLPAIGRAPVAKALPMKTPLSADFKDLFESLVPLAVHRALVAFDGRKTELVSAETTRLRDATHALNEELSSLNLPAALDDAVGGVAVPESVAAKAARVASAGGLPALRKAEGELPALLTRNRELLDETTRLLEEEKGQDDGLRAQHKAKWTRLASQDLTKPLWEELGKFRAVLAAASEADQKVGAKMAAHCGGMETLSGGEAALRAAIPAPGAGGANANSPAVQELQGLMAQVETLKTQREGLEAELKAATCDMRPVFLKAFAETGSVEEEPLSLAQLAETYGKAKEAVAATLGHQEALLSSVRAANARFDAEKSGGGAEREAALKALAAAHDAFMELRCHLQEGAKFYNDLTPLLVRLQQKVSDFVFARKTESDDLLKQIK